MPNRREFPRDMDPDPSDSTVSETGPQNLFVGHSEWRPINEWEAVMRAPPYDEPEISRAERLPLRDIIVDAVEQLTDEEQWIFDAIVIRKCSLRELSRELSVSKTSIARKRDRIYTKLRHTLSHHLTIARYLRGY